MIHKRFPETALMILSAHVEVDHAMRLLASGRRTGYMLKSRVTDLDEFLDAVGRVTRGGSVVDPALVQELVAARDVEDPLEVLTGRERDVLALMAEGRSNAGIGRRLWITEGTVASTCTASLAEFGTRTSDGHQSGACGGRIPRRSSDQLELVGLIAVDGGEHLSVVAADTSIFARNPIAELASIRSAYSASSWVEIKIRWGTAT